MDAITWDVWLACVAALFECDEFSYALLTLGRFRCVFCAENSCKTEQGAKQNFDICVGFVFTMIRR
jgi:hypothetical protein